MSAALQKSKVRSRYAPSPLAGRSFQGGWVAAVDEHEHLRQTTYAAALVWKRRAARE